MTTYTERVAAAKATLQDYARDLAADLGKISRNKDGYRTAGSPSPMFMEPDPAKRDVQHLARLNKHLTNTCVESYALGAGWASLELEKAQYEIDDQERAALNDLKELVTAVKSVTNLDEANALVASFTD